MDVKPGAADTPGVEVLVLGSDLLAAEVTAQGNGKPCVASAFYGSLPGGGWEMQPGTGTWREAGEDGAPGTVEAGGEAAAAAFALLGRGVALWAAGRAAEAVRDRERHVADIEAKAVASREALAEQRSVAAGACLRAGVPVAETQPDAGIPFQERTRIWMDACFGATEVVDVRERSHRHLEEALELSQACGCTEGEAARLVAYVFGRPVGDGAKEVGGTMLTLAALCVGIGADMDEEAERELARVWTMVERIRAKRASREEGSPLPGK